MCCNVWKQVEHCCSGAFVSIKKKKEKNMVEVMNCDLKINAALECLIH